MSKVLIVDDERSIRRTLAQFLSNEGYSVDTAEDAALAEGLLKAAASGEECLAPLASQPFDLVITDRAMPHMSGDEVARRIKARHPDVAVIMLTGFGDIMSYADELPECVDLVLGKPLTTSELREAIVNVTR